MADEQKQQAPSPSTLRWKILRQALLRRQKQDEHSDKIDYVRISRKSKEGFNLIPCHQSVARYGLNPFSNPEGPNEVCICYKLPVQAAPELLVFQRTGGAALNDFSICNQYDIDNTGLVCPWPSEEVLAYYCLLHIDMFRSKKVIELGSGFALAGLAIAVASEAAEVVISDGNPQVVDYIRRSITANSVAFGTTTVNPVLLHWNQEDINSFSNVFDIIVASDCSTFFKKFHHSLVRTIKILLKDSTSSEAIFFSPKRGDSLDRFLEEVKSNGLRFTVSDNYNDRIWKRHLELMNGEESWSNYEKDHCYPLLVRIKKH